MSTLKTNSIEPVTHSDPLVFRTNATETMRIDSSGNVGIGTATPFAKLNVWGNSTVNGSANRGTLLVSNTTNSRQIQFGINDTSSVGWIEGWVPGTGGLNLAIQPSGGRLGIGTTNPIRVLDLTINSNNSATTGLTNVDGVAIRNINQGSASGNKVTLRFDTASSGAGGNAYGSTIGFAAIHGESDNNDLWVWSEYWASGLVPSTNTTPIMCFKGSQGTVGIRTSAPSATLDVNGTLKVGDFDGDTNVMVKPNNTASAVGQVIPILRGNYISNVAWQAVTALPAGTWFVYMTAADNSAVSGAQVDEDLHFCMAKVWTVNAGQFLRFGSVQKTPTSTDTTIGYWLDSSDTVKTTATGFTEFQTTATGDAKAWQSNGGNISATNAPSVFYQAPSADGSGGLTNWAGYAIRIA